VQRGGDEPARATGVPRSLSAERAQGPDQAPRAGHPPGGRARLSAGRAEPSPEPLGPRGAGASLREEDEAGRGVRAVAVMVAAARELAVMVAAARMVMYAVMGSA